MKYLSFKKEISWEPYPRLNWVRMHVGQSGVGDEESLSLDRIYDGKTGGRGDLNLVRMKYGKSGENELLNLMRMHDKVRDEHYMERGGAEGREEGARHAPGI